MATGGLGNKLPETSSSEEDPEKIPPLIGPFSSIHSPNMAKRSSNSVKSLLSSNKGSHCSCKSTSLIDLKLRAQKAKLKATHAAQLQEITEKTVNIEAERKKQEARQAVEVAVLEADFLLNMSHEEDQKDETYNLNDLTQTATQETVRKWVMQQTFDDVPNTPAVTFNTVSNAPAVTFNTVSNAPAVSTVESHPLPQQNTSSLPNIPPIYSGPTISGTQFSTTAFRPVISDSVNTTNQPYNQAPIPPTNVVRSPQSYDTVNKPIDSWIDGLVHGQETSQPTRDTTNQLTEAIVKLESERDLPKLELPTFNGSPVDWPKFIEQFFTHVHCRPGIADIRRLDILLSHLQGEAKNLVQGLAYTGRNYGLALQELKTAFGHPVKVARAFVEKLTNGSSISSKDPIALRQFYIIVRDCISTLQQMNYYSDLYSSDTLIKATKRLPSDKTQSWNEFSKKILRSREPNLLDLKTWLKERLEADLNPYAVTTHKMDTRNQDTRKHKFSSPNSNNYSTTKHRSYNSRGTQFKSKPTSQVTSESEKANVSSPSKRTRSLCQDDHYIFKCPIYWNKSVDDRKQIVIDKKLCLNCLKPDHTVKTCTSSYLCRESECNSKHHTSLHSANLNQGHSVNKLQTRESQVCFQIVKVQVFGKNNQCTETYALQDTASEITLIQENLARSLGICGKQKFLTIQTINGETTQNSSKVSFSIKAASQDGELLGVHEAWTVPDDLFQCPAQVIQPEWKHLTDLGLEDVMPSQVKILLGANVPVAHLQLETVIGQQNQPVGIRTMLGWSIIGVAAPRSEDTYFSVNLLCKQDTSLLEQTVEHFWKTESFGVVHTADTPLSTEDRKSQKLLEQTTEYVNGHYQVGMLWRSQDTVLPNNYNAALRRFELLARRLIKDKEFREMYCQTLNSYINNGYARKLNFDETSATSPITWYIPHHGVINPNKPGKVRPVFDAAALYQGTSLNKQLMSGPDLLNNLFGILLRFRLYEIALVADVEAMFHQVAVPERDTDALRFLWKEDILRPGVPDVYKMKVHIFGAVDSPSCANYALKRTATDRKDEFSSPTIESVLKDFYVDDLLKSVETISETIQLYRELTTLLGLGGFRLHKWMSSSSTVLDAIPQSERAVQELNMDLDDVPIQRTLGMRWRVQSDTFHFNPNTKVTPATKRSVISIVSSIFDPCGFLAPFSFRAKCIIQDIWRYGTDWDEQLPPNLQNEWDLWHQELEHLKNFTLPRHHQGFSNSTSEVELHLFSDASEKGFGSVAYMKYKPADGDIKCSFLASKTRVSPNKPQLSIPRLELQAAVLSVRLWTTLKKELPIPLHGSFFWTDSTTVIQYINNKTKRFKPFVSNRIAEILDNTTPDQWLHVPTKSNTADYCSRGLPASQLTPIHPWFKGPQFLWKGRDQWPSQFNCIEEPDSSDPEIKVSCLIQTNNQLGNFLLPSLQIGKLIDPTKFSTWPRLARHSAWVIRALRNFLVPIQRLNLTAEKSDLLLPQEYEHALLHWTKQAQEDSYPQDVECLKTNKDLPVESHLLPLTPTYDGHHLRLGGRLRKANIPLETKNQIILPKNHAITRLLLYESHLQTAHGGVEYMIADIRRQFWPVSVRQMAKKVNHDCLFCKLRRASPRVPRIADLPTCRTDCFPGPFFHTGVDYFGPMYTTIGRKTNKRWGCLFTCMATRAVHLELADSLESDDFIMVLRSFIGRRGSPKHIYSDNGTNFVGARNELKTSLENLQQSIGEFLAPKGISWHFNPPVSPHFGGAWERLVRCTKIALNAVIGTRPVQETVLRTALIEVEAVLNSRPLTYNSSDPDDFTALTPNHFLIGRANYSTCPCEVVDKEINSRRRWKRVQVIANHVCNRFLKEYLPTLSIRHKWKVEQPNLHVNDLVLLVEDNQPRASWSLGRIVEVMPGDDGRVRSAKVKTPKGIVIRPSAKICLLEEDA